MYFLQLKILTDKRLVFTHDYYLFYLLIETSQCLLSNRKTIFKLTLLLTKLKIKFLSSSLVRARLEYYTAYTPIPTSYTSY